MFGGPEPLHRYNHCKHWSLLRSEPLQRRYRGVTGRYKRKRELARRFRDRVADVFAWSFRRRGDVMADKTTRPARLRLDFGAACGGEGGRGCTGRDVVTT